MPHHKKKRCNNSSSTVSASKPYQPVLHCNNFPHAVVTRCLSACGWIRLAGMGNPGLLSIRVLRSRRLAYASSFRIRIRNSSMFLLSHDPNCMRVHGIMLVGDLRTARFTLAVSIRLRRSALHSSFKVSEERPGGLLLLEVDASGSRL